MLSKKRQPGDAPAFGLHAFHFAQFSNIFEPSRFQEEFDRGVMQRPSATTRNDNVPNLIPKL
jgi:hypothetical protein